MGQWKWQSFETTVPNMGLELAILEFGVQHISNRPRLPQWCRLEYELFERGHEECFCDWAFVSRHACRVISFGANRQPRHYAVTSAWKTALQRQSSRGVGTAQKYLTAANLYFADTPRASHPLAKRSTHSGLYLKDVTGDRGGKMP